MTAISRSVVALFGLLIAISGGVAADPVPPDHAAKLAASAKLFTEKVRPYLTTTCLDCHGGSKVKSGFSLATRETLLKGGERGIDVIPGKGKESPLVRFVAHLDEPFMPPKSVVAKDVVEFLTQWIDLGAAYDKPLIESAGPTVKKPMVVTEKDKEYWAYRKLQPTPVPTVKDAAWARNPIDKFLVAKMEAADVTPTADADKHTLIRRVTFDLIGLPPSVEDVEAFIKDKSPNAYEKVVDRLLASSQFGERWARHWLDPARYGESHGFEHDYYRPNAYHYRDFVIKALNADMPHKQFLEWQLAGDELAPGDPLALAATGFLGAGVYPTQITNSEAERIRYDAMDDMLATTGYAMLALTVACARCHDHKYDPIPTKDYYRMLSAFTTTVRAEVEVDLGTAEEKKANAEFEAALLQLNQDLAKFEKDELPALFRKWLSDQKSTEKPIPKVADAKVAKALQLVWDGKTPPEKIAKADVDLVVKWYAPQDAQWKEKKAKIAELEKKRPKSTKVKIQATTEGQKPMRHHTADGAIPDFYPETFILNRGDAAQKQGPATPGLLQVLTRSPKGESSWLSPAPAGSKTSMRRTGLAHWITDVDQGAGALAARVIVNRLWHHHFGRGIVSTLNDFGFQGDPPTHPELLEWMADDLVKNGWTLKRVHKQMVMSRAYQLSSTANTASLKLDTENKLQHYHPRHRLEAEAIRDNLLAVGGKLDSTMYGPGTLDQGMKRRSIYFQVQRSQLIPMLQVFDWPDTLTSAGARPTTVVTPQALVFLNNPLVRTCADGLAAKLKPAATKDLAAAVDLAYRSTFVRLPSKSEVEAGVAFLKEMQKAGTLDHALSEYAQALMSLNEFITVD